MSDRSRVRLGHRPARPGARSESRARSSRPTAGAAPGPAVASAARGEAPSGYSFADSTAWPPNWLRRAAIIFICGESS